MAGAGSVIIFVIALAGCAIWSAIYLTFAAHYFLTTIIDSSGGHDEVHYPSEAVIDWWWKPLFCTWVLGVFIVPVVMVLATFLARQPLAFFICLALALWVLYPIGLLSALYTQNWLLVLHPGIAGRMLRHFGAFAYVHLITLLSASICAAVLFKVFTGSFLWALPAALLVPTTLLFYARNWGRFAWLSLNFLPRKKKDPFASQKASEDCVPVMDVQEVDPHAEAIREGVPTGSGHAFQSGAPVQGSPHIRAGATPWEASPGPEEDEWATDKKPYAIDDGGLPSFKEQLPAPAPAVSLQTAPVPPLEEEEDEWAPVKKPYQCEDPTHPAPPDPALLAKPEIDRPVVLTKYYDERAQKENAEAARKAAEMRTMPPRSKKTPTFRSALFFGVWEFMIYGRTLSVWTNLVVLTFVELLLLMVVVQFWPRMD
jgi:hypothetical protein